MDYQCIVIYTIVRITPYHPYNSLSELEADQHGCVDWIKFYIKRFVSALVSVVPFGATGETTNYI